MAARNWIGMAVLAIAVGAPAADVQVSLTKTYQTIDGFGGMQDRGWTGYNLLPADRNTLFGNGDGQLGFTILRIRLNESQSAWSNDLVDAKDAASRGIKVFATAWSPPTSLRVASGSSYKVDPSKYQQYVDHLNAFSKYMKDNGVNLYAIGFQNEPDWCGDWSCGTTSEMTAFAKNWGSKIRANGNKVISAESFSFNKGYYDGILNDASALSSVDILGTHFYGTSKSSPDATFDYTLFKTKGGTTPFWMTEVYTADVNNQGSNAWPLCLDVGYEMHRALALSNMSAYVWWYLKRSYGPLHIDANSAQGAASAGTVSKVGAIMGQYAKYIRPGAVRLDATRVAQSDVYSSAFRKGDSLVIVSVNRSSSAKTISYSVPGWTAQQAQRITTSGTKTLAKDASISVSGGEFSSTLDAQSVSTFVLVSHMSMANAWSEAPAGEVDLYGADGRPAGRFALEPGRDPVLSLRRAGLGAGLYFMRTPGGVARSVVLP